MLEELTVIYGFIFENKWLILLVLEVFAWSATFFMLYARYKMQSDFWFKAASAMLIMTGFVPQILRRFNPNIARSSFTAISVEEVMTRFLK